MTRKQEVDGLLPVGEEAGTPLIVSAIVWLRVQPVLEAHGLSSSVRLPHIAGSIREVGLVVDAEPDDVRVEHALGLHTGLVPGVQSVQLLLGVQLHHVAPGPLTELLRLGLGDPGVVHQFVAASLQLSPALGTPGIPGTA